MVKVLFVCLGNICRSPAAEGVMLHLVKNAGLEEKVLVDSAGTSAFHFGEKADARMREHASKRGIYLPSLARQFEAREDFEKFNYILVADKKNYLDIESLDPEHKFIDKVHMLTDFCQGRSEEEVPDPYYGGAAGFELVLDIVTNGCEGLLERIKLEL